MSLIHIAQVFADEFLIKFIEISKNIHLIFFTWKDFRAERRVYLIWPFFRFCVLLEDLGMGGQAGKSSNS